MEPMSPPEHRPSRRSRPAARRPAKAHQLASGASTAGAAGGVGRANTQSGPTRHLGTVAIIGGHMGVGRTTLAVNLAAAAAAASGASALLIDADPRGGASDWWERRVKEKALRPLLGFDRCEPEGLRERVDRARAEGIALVVVDGGPFVDAAAAAMAGHCDLVLVPVAVRRAREILGSGSDAPESVRLLRAAGRPAVAAVLTQCTPANRGPTRGAWGLDKAPALLRDLGLPCCPAAVCKRQPPVRSREQGRGACELEPNSLAAREVEAFSDDAIAAAPGPDAAKAASLAMVASVSRASEQLLAALLEHLAVLNACTSEAPLPVAVQAALVLMRLEHLLPGVTRAAHTAAAASRPPRETGEGRSLDPRRTHEQAERP